MASPLSEHWQLDKSLLECIQFLLDNDFNDLNDVTFRLHYQRPNEKEEVVDISALRYLLVARSPVFFAMFSGKLSVETDRKPIDVHDVEPEAFRLMIRFMYTDEVELTLDNVLSVLSVSNKYIVTKLTRLCVKFLEGNLTADTACVILEQSMLYDEKELKDKALTFMKFNTRAVLASDEFIDLSREGLREVLQLAMICANELEVFEACVKWAEHKCQQKGKSPEGVNIREMLGDNLQLIRFPVMSLEDFTEHVAPRGVLSDRDEFQVSTYLSKSNQQDHLPFSTDPRIDLTPLSLLSPEPYISGQTRCSELYNLTTKCLILKPILLKKILVHHVFSKDASHNYQLSVTLHRGRQRIYSDNDTSPEVISATDHIPAHYAVDLPEVQVEAGSLCVKIELLKPFEFGALSCPGCFRTATFSTSGTSQFADSYINVPPQPLGDKSLLLGIIYSPVISMDI